MSQLTCDGRGYAAFSGRGKSVNNKNDIDKVDTGPLPTGRYYIVDRQSGGHLGWLWDFLEKQFTTDRSKWFALYRDDGQIDDETVIKGITRGRFRLHPIGPARLSEGCITLYDKGKFEELRSYLLKQQTQFVPNTAIKYYGTVDVQ